jgi:hypothetical protein
MPFYMTQAKLSPEAIKGLMANPQVGPRPQAATPAAVTEVSTAPGASPATAAADRAL